jgi:hypothetical protein
MNEFFGLYRGIVKVNDDSSADQPYRGCLKVYIPQVYGKDITDDKLPWAEPCFPYGGGRVAAGDKTYAYGFIAIPPVGASVWIEFVCGNLCHPVWLGCWYGSRDADIEMPDEAIEGYPDTVVLRDPSGEDGMYIRFLKGSAVEIVSRKNDTHITLHRDGNVEVHARSGTVSVESAEGNVTCKAPKGKARLEAGEVRTVTLPDGATVQADVLEYVELDSTTAVISPVTGEVLEQPTATLKVGRLTIQAVDDIYITTPKSAYLMSAHASGFDAH